MATPAERAALAMQRWSTAPVVSVSSPETQAVAAAAAAALLVAPPHGSPIATTTHRRCTQATQPTQEDEPAPALSPHQQHRHKEELVLRAELPAVAAPLSLAAALSLTEEQAQQPTQQQKQPEPGPVQMTLRRQEQSPSPRSPPEQLPPPDRCSLPLPPQPAWQPPPPSPAVRALSPRAAPTERQAWRVEHQRVIIPADKHAEAIRRGLASPTRRRVLPADRSSFASLRLRPTSSLSLSEVPSSNTVGAATAAPPAEPQPAPHHHPAIVSVLEPEPQQQMIRLVISPTAEPEPAKPEPELQPEPQPIVSLAPALAKRTDSATALYRVEIRRAEETIDFEAAQRHLARFGGARASEPTGRWPTQEPFIGIRGAIVGSSRVAAPAMDVATRIGRTPRLTGVLVSPVQRSTALPRYVHAQSPPHLISRAWLRDCL